MALTLLKGRTYRFTQTDNTNDNHPLIISQKETDQCLWDICYHLRSGLIQR